MKPLYFYKFRVHKKFKFYKDTSNESVIKYLRFMFFELLWVDVHKLLIVDKSSFNG